MSTHGECLFRVEKGHAGPEELAAITAVLMASAATQHSAAPARPGRSGAAWCRLEHSSGFRAPHSWQGVAGWREVQ
ncbi:acyl-CoA carboxylase subunit epsilon [Streptomyces griseofuscus]|uniref:acyl-CoA carboxylase subunit epsilon n=1 Tax=Streptomyces griseofuscus TaxID=146922 RepID=UPI0037906192